MSDTAWNRVKHFYCLICRQRCEAAECEKCGNATLLNPNWSGSS